MRRTSTRRLPTALRRFLEVLAFVSILGLAYVTYEAAALNSTWGSIERVPLNTTQPDGGQPDRPSDGVPVPASPETTEPPKVEGERRAPGAHDTSAGSVPATTQPVSTPEPATPPAGHSDTGPSARSTTTTAGGTSIVQQAEDAPAAVALIGTDSRSGLSDLGDFGDFAGQRADVIMLALRSGDEVTLLSVPRDLYVEDTCRHGHHRIGDAYAGCGDRPGLTHLVAELEHVTRTDIQHAAAVDLAGFPAVVDALGGYEICTEHDLRDAKSGLDLAAGCRMADGETTLAWLRSRHTERHVDGGWEPVPGVSDLTRNERQRSFLLDMFERLRRRSGPGAILDGLRTAAPHLTIDDQLSMADAAAWVWRLRGADVETGEIPVRNRATAGGAAVLVPTTDVAQLVDDLAP